MNERFSAANLLTGLMGIAGVTLLVLRNDVPSTRSVSLLRWAGPFPWLPAW
jgi:hypothetical protein